jgi:hypothetical protein
LPATTFREAGDALIEKSGTVTVKTPLLEPVPAGVVTLTAPVVAPVGTLVVMWLSSTTVKLVAEVAPN